MRIGRVRKYGGKITTLLGHWSLDLSAQELQGERYLVLKSATVHERADETARIIDDLPEMRLAYAKPTTHPAWFEVFAVSEDRHPTQRIGSMAAPVHAENGRFIVNDEMPERHQFRPVKGFVARARLAPLRAQPIPESMLGKRLTVPQVLARYGVKDRRFMPANPNQYPYSAVVNMQGIHPNDPEKIAGCSAFLVAPGLLASAGHCLSNGGDQYRWSVLHRLSNTRQAYQEIPAKLIYWSNDKASHGPITDAALFEVDPSAFAGVRPLALASPGPWLQSAALQILVLGFGEDLMGMKIRRSQEMGLTGTAGVAVPHGDLCTLPAGQMELLQPAHALRLVWPFADCTSYPGDSGGPLLIWNEATSQFEVLGIAAQMQHVWLRDRRANRHWTEEAQALVANAAEQTATEYGFEMKDKQGVPVPHASGALIRHARLTSPWQADWADMWNIDARVYAEVAKATGQPDGYQRLRQALAGDESAPRSIMVRWKDSVERVLSGPFETELRAAWWRHSQKQPAPAQPATQWRTTYDWGVDLAKAVGPGGSARAWRLGRFLELGERLVPDDQTLPAYLEAMQREVDTRLQQRPELRSSLSRYIDLHRNYRILVVADDWFVVDAQSGRVIEVKRGWSSLAAQEAQKSGR